MEENLTFEDNKENLLPSRLDSFKKAKSRMIATNQNAYRETRFGTNRLDRTKGYSLEEIESIIQSGGLKEQQQLSRYYFSKDGYYKEIIQYYATLLMYVGLLIPNPSIGKKLSTPHIQKKYYAALDFVDNLSFETMMVNMAWRALVDGAYYGLQIDAGKDKFVVLDLPFGYTRSRFKDLDGKDIVEFDLTYFNSITDIDSREKALQSYPDFIQKTYKKRKELKNNWIFIPSDIGVCFPFFDGPPPFLSVIPHIVAYEQAIETDNQREADRISKIIVQKMPHLTDGRLVFEPDEAQEMHEASVGMLRQNPNTRVLTTYGEVSAIASKESSENATERLDKFENNIYAQAGISKHIFSAENSSFQETSLNNDLSLVMYFANKVANFFTDLINKKFSNGNISFAFKILPVSYYNQNKYIDTSLKMGSSGYGLLIPSIAQGISQKNLIGLKELENDLLKLPEKLKPLSSSYTQSPTNEESSSGRPEKEEDERSEKTVQNRESKDVTGGTE